MRGSSNTAAAPVYPRPSSHRVHAAVASCDVVPSSTRVSSTPTPLLPPLAAPPPLSRRGCATLLWTLYPFSFEGTTLIVSRSLHAELHYHRSGGA